MFPYPPANTLIILGFLVFTNLIGEKTIFLNLDFKMEFSIFLDFY